jgi:hypothetical protein
MTIGTLKGREGEGERYMYNACGDGHLHETIKSIINYA